MVMAGIDLANEEMELLSSLQEDISQDKWEELIADVSRKKKHRSMYRDKDGDTILHLLIAKQHPDVIKYISEKSDIREINAVNKLGQTPLHLAIFLGSIPIIEAILKKGLIDYERYDHQLNTPIHLACLMPPEQAVTITQLLIKEVSHSSLINARNEDGLAPIHLAAIQQNAELIKLLVHHGADINSREAKSGKSCIMILASLEANVDIITYVINMLNADVNMTSYEESRALHFACEANATEVVKILLLNNAEVGVKNLNKKTERDLTTNIEIKKLLDSHLRRCKRILFNT